MTPTQHTDFRANLKQRGAAGLWATVGALGALAAFAGPAAAEGQGVEARFGVMAHNIKVIDGKNADKEDGPNLSLEAAFPSPDWLDWAGSPRPYLTASINTAGATSFAGGGVEWDWALGGGWAINPGLGLVAHNGELENKFPSGDPRATAFAAENVLLGSRVLFRTSLGLSYDFDSVWRVQVQYEHLSHGQILAKGRNQGLDTLGLRIAYRFGG
jgi:lipid A 3-O-deacylase